MKATVVLSLALLACAAAALASRATLEARYEQGLAVYNEQLAQAADRDGRQLLPPDVSFISTWSRKHDPNGRVDCGDYLTFSFRTQIESGAFSPTNLNVYIAPDPKLTLQHDSVRTTYGTITEGNEKGDNKIGVAVGDLTAFTETVLFVTFDVQITDYIDGSSFIDDATILVTQDFWPPAYDNSSPFPPLRFECFDSPSNVGNDDDDFSGGVVSAIVILTVLGAVLIVALLAFLLGGLGGGQRFKGAGPSNFRENPDA